MNTPVSRTQNATATKTPPPPNAEQVGELATRFYELEAKAAPIKDKLARIDEALRDPKHADKKAELEDLKAKYTKELKPYEAAKKALDAGLQQLIGATGRDGVEKGFARLEALDKEIAAAWKKTSEAITTFKEAVDAAEAASKKFGKLSPQADKAIAGAVALQKVMERAEKVHTSLKDAKKALTGDVQAREDRVFAEAKKSGDPALADIVDLKDLAGTHNVRQVKVLGAPVVGVDAQEAVKADVGRIALATKSGHPDVGAQNAARMLEKQLQTGTKDHQRALVKAASDPSNNQIANIAQRAQTNPQVTAAMLDATKAAGGSARDVLGKELAKATTRMDSAVIEMLDARMKKGDGFEEAYALVRGLKETGNTMLSSYVDGLMSARLKELTSKFEEASKELAPVRGDLARLVGGFGPLLPADKQQAAVDAFKARHRSEFEAWEAAGAKLARASKFITEHSWNDKAQDLLGEALTTKGGENMILAALKDQSQGLPTFLDGGADAVKDGTKLGKQLPYLVVKTLGAEALRLAGSGRQADALKLLDTMKNNSGLLMVKGDTIDHLKGILNGEKGSVEAFAKEVNHVKPETGAYKALKGLAYAASIVNGIQRIRNNDDLKSYVKGTGEILGGSADMAAMAIELVAKSETAGILSTANAARLAKAGAVFSALGAVLDGISAVQSFRNGEIVDGVANTASALGGAILAVDAFAVAAGMQVVPVWGQVAGAALVIGAVLTKWINAERKAAKAEKKSEDDAQAYLEAAGIDTKRADELSDLKRSDGRNVGMMIQQLAPAMGMKPKELWDKIVAMSPGRIDDFVDMTKDLVLDKDGRIAATNQGYKDSDTMKTVRVPGDGKGGSMSYEVYPQSLPNAVAWTKKFLNGED